MAYIELNYKPINPINIKASNKTNAIIATNHKANAIDFFGLTAKNHK